MELIISKLTLLDFGSDYQSKQNLNANNVALRAAFDNTLSRDGTSPNQMTSSLDMNSNRIINLHDPVLGSDAVTLNYMASNLAGYVAPAPITTSVAASVLNYPALRAYSLTGLADGAIFYVQGFAAVGDGGEGFWRLQSTSPGADNSGTRITSNTAGKYFVRQFQGPVIDLWFGVKADGSTDNTASLQAVEDYAFASGKAIYYPAQANYRRILGTINTYYGVEHFGDGMNGYPFTTGTAATGTSTIYKNSGAGSVFALQASTGVNFTFPGPSWRDMNINTDNGNGITLNSIAGGFTDDLTTQAALVSGKIHRVGFECGGSHCVGLFKCNFWSITECVKQGSTNGFYVYGSDNVLIQHNFLENAVTYEINAQAAGATFGNQLWIKDNVLSGPNNAATAHINSTYRQIYITGNFIEGTGTLTGYPIQITAGINAVVAENEIDWPVGGGGTWLSVTNTFANLQITDNKTGIGPIGNTIWNGGNGHKAYVTSTVRAYINATGPMIGGIPFVTPFGALQTTYQQEVPPVAGSTYWTFNPNVSNLDSSAGSYYQSVMVRPNGFYNLPANATISNSQIGFTAPAFTITDNIDVWVLAYGPVAGQVLSLVIGGVTYTQALTTAPAWYKMVSNVAVVAAASLQIYNTDTTRNGSAYIGNIKVMKH